MAVTPKDFEDFDHSFDSAVEHMSAVLRGARELKGLPLGIVVLTPAGPIIMTPHDLPRDAWPSLEEWIAMWPDKPCDASTGFTITVPSARKEGL